MKKNFEQPALEVVRMRNNDIVTLSDPVVNLADEKVIDDSGLVGAPGQRGVFDWDAGY